MAELADALDSGSSESDFMWVQVPSPAPKHSNPNLLPIGGTFGFVVLFFVVIMSIFGFAYCSRLLSIMTMVTTIAELMYLGIVDDSSGNDYYITNIY